MPTPCLYHFIVKLGRKGYGRRGLAKAYANWGRPCSTGAEPAFQVAPMDDAKHEQHPLVVDHVVHNAIVADPESMEGVSHAANCLDRLAWYALWACDIAGQAMERLLDSLLNIGRQLLERLR